MDWSKAKTILILSFLFLNLFLGYQLWQDQRQQNVQGQIAQLQIEELKARLSQAEITYPEDITDQTPELHYMNLSANALKEQDFSANLRELNWKQTTAVIHFKNPISIDHALSIEEKNKIVTGYVHFLDQYQYDPMLSTHTDWVYTQRINDYPVFTSTLKLSFTGDSWTGYEQSYYLPIDLGVSRKVVSAYTALAVLFDNGILQKGEAVQQIALGYYFENYDTDVRFLVPVWRVAHTQGIHYINGFTGAIMGTSK